MLTVNKFTTLKPINKDNLIDISTRDICKVFNLPKKKEDSTKRVYNRT